MNKEQANERLDAIEKEAEELRKILNSPEEWDKHSVGAIDCTKYTCYFTVRCNTREQAEYARTIVDGMNFQRPPEVGTGVQTRYKSGQWLKWAWSEGHSSDPATLAAWHGGAIRREQ